MSKALANLINKPEPIITRAIEELERLSGYPSEDVRLLAEVTQKLGRKVTSLGLDPHDTTAPELYHSLLTKFEADSSQFARILGLDSDSSAEAKLQTVIAFVRHAEIAGEVWALKPSAAKNLLKSVPPKQLMRQLNYRSPDSMLKRENIEELYAALPFTESRSWLTKFDKEKSRLSAGTFEARRPGVLVMPFKRWAKLAGSAPAVGQVAELGTVAVWPAPNFSRQSALALSVLTLKALEGLKIKNTLLKLNQVRSDFGKMLATSPQYLPEPLLIAGYPLATWRSLHHFFASRPAHEHPMVLEPHLQPQDMHISKVSQALARAAPVCAWWDTDTLSSPSAGGPVSLNICDVVHNKLTGRSFNKRIHHNMASELWDELIARYLRHPAVQSHLLSQLGDFPQSSAIIDLNKLVPQMAEA